MATEEKDNKGPELHVEEREDGTAFVADEGAEVKPVSATPAPTEGADDAPGDGEPSDEHEDDGQHADDADGGADAVDENPREKLREERARERKNRRSRRTQHTTTLERTVQRLERELQEVRSTAGQARSSVQQADMQRLERDLDNAQQAVTFYNNAVAEAMVAQNSEAMRDANEKLYQARRRTEVLSGIKEQFTQSSQQEQRRPPAMDPLHQQFAAEWTARNRWFNPASNDPDTQVALVIDKQVAGDNFIPNTREYWDELDDRLAKYLPHRVGGGNIRTEPNDSTPRKGAPKGGTQVNGGGRESGGAGTEKKGYVLSAARVSAMKEADLWDDPKKRERMIKSYREQDRKMADERRSNT